MDHAISYMPIQLLFHAGLCHQLQRLRLNLPLSYPRPLLLLYTSRGVAAAYKRCTGSLDDLRLTAARLDCTIRLEWRYDSVHLVRDVLGGDIPTTLDASRILARPQLVLSKLM